MFALFMYLVVWQNDSPKTLFYIMWGLANRVCHQDDLMLSSYLADDLNSGLGRGAWSVRKKSALIFLLTSRNKAVGACCTEQGAATDRLGGPRYKYSEPGRG
jgi:hypothetical protein